MSAKQVRCLSSKSIRPWCSDMRASGQSFYDCNPPYYEVPRIGTYKVYKDAMNTTDYSTDSAVSWHVIASSAGRSPRLDSFCCMNGELSLLWSHSCFVFKWLYEIGVCTSGQQISLHQDQSHNWVQDTNLLMTFLKESQVLKALWWRYTSHQYECTSFTYICQCTTILVLPAGSQDCLEDISLAADGQLIPHAM